MSADPTQIPEPTKTPEQINEPTPLPEEIKGGFSLSSLNPFGGPKNAEEIKISSQNKIAELNTQIQTLEAEIKSKTTELAIKQNELKLISSQRLSGGKKSKKSHKKSHKKTSRKTR